MDRVDQYRRPRALEISHQLRARTIADINDDTIMQPGDNWRLPQRLRGQPADLVIALGRADADDVQGTHVSGVLRLASKNA